MWAKKSHTRILSLLMLVLYGFIITPAALWHSHSCDGTLQVCKQSGGDDTSPAAGDSCPICQHTYASHIAGESVHLEVSTVVFRLHRESFTKQIPFIFTGHADTRGSPVVAVPSFVS